EDDKQRAALPWHGAATSHARQRAQRRRPQYGNPRSRAVPPHATTMSGGQPWRPTPGSRGGASSTWSARRVGFRRPTAPWRPWDCWRGPPPTPDRRRLRPDAAPRGAFWARASPAWAPPTRGRRPATAG